MTHAYLKEANHINPPYSTLADFYDLMMNHVDYSKWAAYIRKALKLEGIPDGKVLELAAGTGTFACHFSKSKNMIITDSSYSMLKKAQAKKILKSIPKIICDARAISFKKHFQVVLGLYDSMNYLLSRTELKVAFCEVWRVLLQGGVFIFDLTTGYNSKIFFSNNDYHEENFNKFYRRKSTYDVKLKIQKNEIWFKEKRPGHLPLMGHEIHQQKIYEIAEITSLLGQVGLNVLGVWDGFTFRKADDKSLRIHIMAQK